MELQRLCPFVVSGSLNNHPISVLKAGGSVVCLYPVYTLFIPSKIKTTENQVINSRFVYPDPGSNRDGSESTGV